MFLCFIRFFNNCVLNNSCQFICKKKVDKVVEFINVIEMIVSSFHQFRILNSSFGLYSIFTIFLALMPQ